MDDNKLRFGVGVLVIAAIGVGIILTFLFGAFPTVLSNEYTLLVKFPSATGVSTNTPVLRDGVKIGRVTDIKLLETGGVLLELAMDATHQLSHEYVPYIGTGSVITREAKLKFVRADPQLLRTIFPEPADQAMIPKPYADMDYLNYGKKEEDPFNVLFGLEEDIRNTMLSIQRAGDSIDNAGKGVNLLVGDARQAVGDVRQAVGGTDSKVDAIADEAVQALKEFQGAMRDVRSIVGNPDLKVSLEQSLGTLPDVLKEAKETLESTQRTFEKFENVGSRFERVGEVAEDAVKDVGDVVANVNNTVDTVRNTVEGAGETLNTIQGTFKSAERTIQNVEKFSEPLAQRGDEIVLQVLQSLRSAEKALVQVEAFGSSLNNNDGTIKRLLEDDHMYWQIRRTIENVEQASARIKPILDDARIFSDKIARDPRQLGVRGAITRQPNGIGLK